jgi:hypothetical protein
MTRSLWSLVAMIGSSLVLSGCAMCEHCLDYDYPAFGGCCGWHADDHCRAGSAFCGMHASGGFEVPPDAIEVTDPVPDSVMTTPTEERPPADLSPPSGRRMRPLGNEPLPSNDAATGDLELPPSLDGLPVDDGSIPDPYEP